jgi:hypothetical protein
MALLLGAYCISSIRAARRDAKHGPGMSSAHHRHHTHPLPPGTGTNSHTTKAIEGTESSQVIRKVEKRKKEEKAREEVFKTLRKEEG